MPSSNQRTFDVVKAEHPANRRYAAAAVRPGWLSRPHRERRWTPGRQLNQGSEGACVGFGCMAEALATPVRTKAAVNADAQGFRMYAEAKRLDEWGGENYEGTSLTGGGNAMKALGYLDRYLWLHTPEEIALAIAYSGPVVIGIPWTTGMDALNEPDEYFEDGGTLRGWHCVLLYGAHGFGPGARAYDHGPWFDLRNSWGGASNGRLPASVMARMFEAGADAWVAEGRHQVGMLGVPQG
jgi:hypothetical protein